MKNQSKVFFLFALIAGHLLFGLSWYQRTWYQHKGTVRISFEDIAPQWSLEASFTLDGACTKALLVFEARPQAQELTVGGRPAKAYTLLCQKASFTAPNGFLLMSYEKNADETLSFHLDERWTLPQRQALFDFFRVDIEQKDLYADRSLFYDPCTVILKDDGTLAELRLPARLETLFFEATRTQPFGAFLRAALQKRSSVQQDFVDQTLTLSLGATKTHSLLGNQKLHTLEFVSALRIQPLHPR